MFNFLPNSDAARTLALRLLMGRLSSGRLTCPHCLQTAVPLHVRLASFLQPGVPETAQVQRQYSLVAVSCPACIKDTLFVCHWQHPHSPHFAPQELAIHSLEQVQPLGRAPKLFRHVPDDLLKDYRAACRTLAASSEASACMSRRCLQSMLRTQGYNQRDLAPQIDALLAERDPDKALPKSIRSKVDHIRNFGNFGAHAKHDIATLEIIPVEKGEAEWCIEIVEALFNHYFDEVEAAKAMIASANQKYNAAGSKVAKT